MNMDAVTSSGLASRRVIRLTVMGLAILTITGFLIFDYKNIILREAVVSAGSDFWKMFAQARPKHFSVAASVRQVLVTIGLAFLTTVIGGIWGLFGGLLAARNLAGARMSASIKGLVAVVRAIPTVLWVLIFAVTCGLGGTAAVLGMSFHSAGYLIKAYAESFEEVDSGIIEALRAGGASWLQVICQGVLPSSFSYLLAWTFMRFELNFTVAVAMGVAAGAGGIGFELFMASSLYFDIREVGFITYLILAVAVGLEMGVNGLRRHVLALA